MAVVRIGPKNQVTISAEVMKKLKLKQGDFLEIQATEDGVQLVPQRLIPRDQAWYWTKEWQEMEREADEDIASGRVSPIFDSADEAIAYLHRPRE